MATRLEVPLRPVVTADYTAPSRYRPVGFVLALAGLMIAGVAFIANVVAASDLDGEILAWSWGLNTVAFATIKLAIAAILIGIVARLWMRVDSVKAALPDLRRHVDPDATPETGELSTLFGPAAAAATTPAPLPIHTMAKRLWPPMLGMGAMAVVAGFITSLVWSGKLADGTAQAAQAWTQGLQFLGEGFLLAGIAFLLGTILGSLREGGGEVQESLGVTVKTLRMPATAKLFVGLMVLGVTVSIAQFVLYIAAAGLSSPQSFASWAAWLGPTREVGLGLILAGIVLALVTIGNALGFQFHRIREIIATGR